MKAIMNVVRFIVLSSTTIVVSSACAAALQAGGQYQKGRWAQDLARSVSVVCRNDADYDTTALNTAISNSPSGSSIHIHGTCLVNATIILYGDRSYFGDSRTGTIIRQAPGRNLAALVASDSWAENSDASGDPIMLAHLTLDGNKAANSGTDDLIIRSWLTTVTDIEVTNAPGDGILLTNVSRNGTALAPGNTMVNSRYSNLFIQNSGANGFHVIDSGNSITDTDLLDSWIANSGQSAIYLENAAGWKIRGDHLYAVKDDAIYANRCFGTAIESNYIENFGEAGGGTYYGIACTVQGTIGSIISNNKIFMIGGEASSGTFDYIAVPKLNYGIGYISIDSNLLVGSGSPNDNGLTYENLGGMELYVLSSENNLQLMHNNRTVGRGVSLAASY